jgi:cation-transporting P-type ATPase 13A2
MPFGKYNPGDTFIDIEGRKKTIIYHMYNFLCIMSLGILYMICKYSPRIKNFLTTKKSELRYADCVFITNKFNKVEIREIIEYSAQKTRNLSRYLLDGKIRVLDTEYARFIYDVGYNKFVTCPYKFSKDINFHSVYLEKIKKPEHKQKIDLIEKEILYGKNTNNLRLPSVIEILLKNTFNLTNLIDIFCVILWFNIEYKVYGFIVGLFRLYTYVEENYLEITQKYEIENSQKHRKIKTLRNGKFVYIDSYDLFPGDLVYIETCEEFPCDAVILKGDAITNESFLTGESVPICKSSSQKSIVYSGTAVLRSVDNSMEKFDPKFVSLYRVKNLTKKEFADKPVTEKKQVFENCAVGLVIATGFNTSRGRIMKDIINPKPVSIPFLKQARSFIFYTIGVALILTIFLSLYFKFVLEWELLDNFIYSADLFFTLASPALYASLSVGLQISNKKLKEDNIKCNNVERIYLSGNIDMAIFDKTGTLTSEGMEFLYIDNCNSKMRRIEEVDLYTRIGLSSCHSVYELDGKYSGDVLDIQMFVFSSSTLEFYNDNMRKVNMESSTKIAGPFLKEYGDESEKHFYQNMNHQDILESKNLETSCRNKLENNTVIILKTYDFTSDSKRMSVIIEYGNKKYIYTKGSCDIMKTLIKNGPDEYEDKVKEHSLSGYRVIAMAYKEIQEIGTRETDEKDLTFLGLIAFSNKLKPETYGVIEELNNADIKSIICTGDNILTAISVARECNIIEDSTTVIFPVLNDDCKDVYDVEWVCLGDEDLVFDKVRLNLYKNNFDNYCNDFVIACEGKEYNFFKDTNYYQFILKKCVVFAKFSPGLKKSLVEDFRNLGKVTLFCGDGANDSGAISSADVGVALAQNEASLASSFCAKNIESVLVLIKECRNAYVTSIALFKYVSMSYVLAFVCLGFPVLRCLFLSDFQTLHVDIFIILPMMFCISNFKKSSILSKTPPSTKIFRTNELIAYFVSLFFQSIIIALLSMYGPGSDKITEESKAGTMIFFVTAFQSIFNGIYLSDCVPHRESIFENGKILRVSALFGAFNLLLLILNWGCKDLSDAIFSIYLFVDINNRELLYIIMGIFSSLVSCFVVPYYIKRIFGSKNNEDERML